MKHHIRKKIALFFSVVSLTSLMSSCSLDIVVINTKGSSSVQPFLNDLSSIYAKKHAVEISVQAGGSSSGITGVLDGTTNIGNVSRSPRGQITANESFSKQWEEDGIKTVTLAKDAIALIYKKPKDLDNKDFYIDSHNISKLYDAFAGHEAVSLSDFYFGDASLGDVNLTPFARSGGASVSGTAEAFLENSNLIDEHDLDNKTLKTLQGSIDYGYNTITTGESNVEAYKNFQANAKLDGSITYLSLGYIMNNIKTIHDDGFEIMNYKKDDVVVPTLETVASNDYQWVRPYNIVFSLNKNDVNKLNSIKEFIKFAVFSSNFEQSEEIKQAYKKQGLIQLNDDELKQMFLLDEDTQNQSVNDLITNNENKFWVSDYSFKPVRFGVEF
ncbi:substrate-binding domain-containing protein [Mycoplasma sp. E35C]|uniref:substrate-binding domain-containing protein n=1 Tax=Mycoplasma sp. E35C TaxID=2801918 RepID=UPI001CA400F6|nr:PstS family phosphate ABC transporter substrate-binding protein [Mycoplasma sp. E35C]QZX49181.1 PstS family phosphate ABC transporter substrate-binding protein [Mycoplasma sp. E35C]